MFLPHQQKASVGRDLRPKEHLRALTGVQGGHEAPAAVTLLSRGKSSHRHKRPPLSDPARVDLQPTQPRPMCYSILISVTNPGTPKACATISSPDWPGGTNTINRPQVHQLTVYREA